MTTEITYPTFLETSENLEGLNKFMSLLNFWHISKINKEQGFIKRHGLHPVLKDFVQTTNPFISGQLTYNSFALEGSSDIEKMVFTVFRIYLEKQFSEFEVSKVRDAATWVFSLENDAFGLDNPMFLRILGLRMVNQVPQLGILRLEDLSARGYRNYRSESKFSLRYPNLTQGLLVKQLEKDLTDVEILLSTQADEMINHSLRSLMGHDRFLESLGLDPKAKVKVPKKKKEAEIEIEVTTGRPVSVAPTRTGTSPGIQSLVELYRNLGSPIENLGTTDLFNYLVSYMRVANPERVLPELSNATIREFETAIRAVA